MKRRKSGFTLIELLFAVAIITILASVVVPAFSSQTGVAEKAVCSTNRRSLQTMVMTGYFSGDYDSFQAAFDAIYDEDIYTCPSGGHYTWVANGLSGSVVCDIHGTGTTPGSPSSGTSSAVSSGTSSTVSSGSSSSSVPETVTLIDSASEKHTFHATEEWSVIQEKIGSGWNIPDGYIFADSTGIYLCCSWSQPYLKEDAGDLTVEKLVSRYPHYFVKLDSSNLILIEKDRVDSYGNMVWKSEVKKGTLCYFKGVYYVAPGTISIWTMPPSGWITVKQ